MQHPDFLESVDMAQRGAVFGLLKTLSLEWPNVFCRAVDVAENVKAETAAGMVAAEICCPNHALREVGYTVDGKRHTTHASNLDTPRGEKGLLGDSFHRVTKDDVFMVSGGGRGISHTASANLPP